MPRNPDMTVNQPCRPKKVIEIHVTLLVYSPHFTSLGTLAKPWKVEISLCRCTNCNFFNVSLTETQNFIVTASQPLCSPSWGHHNRIDLQVTDIRDTTNEKKSGNTHAIKKVKRPESLRDPGHPPPTGWPDWVSLTFQLTEIRTKVMCCAAGECR